MVKIKKEEALKNSKTLVDNLGFVFSHDDAVYRAITNSEYANIYTELLISDLADELFEAGLVRTKIETDLYIEGVPLILKHEKVPFILHPSEYTNLMFWEAVKTKISLAKILANYGYILKDGNPYNISFNGNKPVFIDFTSIVKKDSIPVNWINVFIKHFAVPLWLSNKKKLSPFSIEYRREHHNGFGTKLFANKHLKRVIFRQLNHLNRYRKTPSIYIEKLDQWLEKQRPVKAKIERWSKYKQAHNASYQNPTTTKQKFVFDILKENKPKKVLDLASNKGFYAAMAAHMGIQVIAFDYEEDCINECMALARDNDLNITPALMNFYLPSPPHGWGLLGEDSYSRFRSNIVLALGLIHHICITQKVPVSLFCEICKKYALNGVILEFVDPTDKHVSSWRKSIPENYSIDGIYTLMKEQFPKMTKSIPVTDNGINRTYLYFSKT